MTRVRSADKEELVERFRRDMTRLLAAIDRVPTASRSQPICGEWRLKDIAAHIAAWDRELLRALDQLLAGEKPRLIQYRENDFNAGVIAATKALGLAKIRRETRAAHAALLRRLRDLPLEQWRRPSAYRWRRGQPITVASLFGYTYHGETHYAGHAAEVEAANGGSSR